ncbi:hypothetical protein [Streptomyces sp. NPDC002952]|uniref:hypothetical protein n=1 Tax=Streptomyces sp. NPDC002952 TaxID=3364673 RepID=UPI0036C7083D
MSGAQPTLRALSLGAGVQSTTLLLLAAEGRLPPLDVAVFADTGWEPEAVYRHLARLEKSVARPAGIPVVHVSSGDIRADALDPHAHYAQMPLYVKSASGKRGMLRRACTADYKVKPIKKEIRRRLGFEHPRPVPAGVWAEQWIGISLDEASRAARMSDDVAYMRSAFPLLFLARDASWPGRAVGWSHVSAT